MPPKQGTATTAPAPQTALATSPESAPPSWIFKELTDIKGAIGRLDGILVGIHAELGRLASEVAEVKKEVAGHGKWMHTAKWFGVALGNVLFILISVALWPWLKAKLFH